ncbi:MAG: hypothetical protein Q9187_006382 [Circinaria calcarea]
MASTAAKISPTAFRAAIGTLLAVALILASARTYIRYRRFRRLFVDDAFLFAAVVGLIIGTIMTYVNIPFIYVQVNVMAGLQAPPADFVEQLVLDQKTQAAATVFLWVAIFGVKFSFLACFRNLVRRLRKMTIWWWCVLAVLIPAAIICMCGFFIACSTFGPGVLLLIVISIIKVAAVNTIGKQVDTTWGIFWLQAEASIAVMVVSLAVFRSLFVPDTSRVSDEPKGSPITTRTRNSFNKLWRTRKPQDSLTQDSLPQDGLPSVPLATFSGARTSIRGNQSGRNNSSGSENGMVPMEGPGIRVTHHISTSQVQAIEKDRPSYESFV